MGVLDKLAFWKKKEDLGLGNDFGADLGAAPTGPDLGMPQQPGMARDLGLPSRDLGMPEDTGFGAAQPRAQPPAQPPGQFSPMQQPFGAPMQPQQPTQADYKSDKFEVVSAKLDSIRYTLESINQRLANLERIAHGEHEGKKRW
jgi:hypothetical protein